MDKWLIGLKGLILGLGTVFLVLILLIVFINIMSSVVQRLSKKKTAPIEQKPVIKKDANPIEDENEIIAAITAAIACIGQREGKKYNIRSLRRV
jgi:sodium pump decarboxylase gamma subunit